MERLFQETWFLWWLFALVAIGRWYWVNLGPGGRGHHRGCRTWKELYRAALVEREADAVASRLTEAEEAIQYELLTHPFSSRAERQSLQDALSNLGVLRDNTDAIGAPRRLSTQWRIAPSNGIGQGLVESGILPK